MSLAPRNSSQYLSSRKNNFMQNKLSSFLRVLFLLLFPLLPFSRIDSSRRRKTRGKSGKTESFAEMDIRPFRIRGSFISMYSEPTSDKDDERSLPRGTDRIINFSESKVHRISPFPLSSSKSILLLLLLEDRFTRFPRVLENAVIFKGEGDRMRLGAAVFYRETRHA